MANDDAWDARRIESWAGEVRVNLIRLVAIAVFYGQHIVNVYLFRDDPTIAGTYHTSVTALVLAWSVLLLLLYFCLSRRWLPPALKYLATSWDIILITLLLMLTRDPKTMLAVLYFPVLGAATLRLSLPLVYFTTLATMGAYLYFLGYIRYWLQLPAEQRLSRPQQMVFLLALGTAGLLAGQVVRQARRLVAGYPITVREPG